jgi:cytochrome b561
LIITGIIVIFLNRQQLFAQDFRHYKGIFKQFGSITRIGYFSVLSIYPIYLLLKSKKIKNLHLGDFQAKAPLQFLAKLARKWHVPVALISSGIVALHGLLAIIRGFKFNFTYLSGIASMVILLFLILMGLKRFKRADHQWHFKLAIGFLILFMIHATFA